MNQERFETFGKLYEQNLTQAVLNYPEEYVWPVENVPTVAKKMLDAVVKNSYNKDGRAFKATCKQLGIKYTYKAIDEYLERI